MRTGRWVGGWVGGCLLSSSSITSTAFSLPTTHPPAHTRHTAAYENRLFLLYPPTHPLTNPPTHPSPQAGRCWTLCLPRTNVGVGGGDPALATGGWVGGWVGG